MYLASLIDPSEIHIDIECHCSARYYYTIQIKYRTYCWIVKKPIVELCNLVGSEDKIEYYKKDFNFCFYVASYIKDALSVCPDDINEEILRFLQITRFSFFEDTLFQCSAIVYAGEKLGRYLVVLKNGLVVIDKDNVEIFILFEFDRSHKFAENPFTKEIRIYNGGKNYLIQTKCKLLHEGVKKALKKTLQNTQKVKGAFLKITSLTKYCIPESEIIRPRLRRKVFKKKKEKIPDITGIGFIHKISNNISDSSKHLKSMQNGNYKITKHPKIHKKIRLIFNYKSFISKIISRLKSFSSFFILLCDYNILCSLFSNPLFLKYFYKRSEKKSNVLIICNFHHTKPSINIENIIYNIIPEDDINYLCLASDDYSYILKNDILGTNPSNQNLKTESSMNILGLELKNDYTTYFYLINTYNQILNSFSIERNSLTTRLSKKIYNSIANMCSKVYRCIRCNMNQKTKKSNFFMNTSDFILKNFRDTAYNIKMQDRCSKNIYYRFYKSEYPSDIKDLSKYNGIDKVYSQDSKNIISDNEQLQNKDTRCKKDTNIEYSKYKYNKPSHTTTKEPKDTENKKITITSSKTGIYYYSFNTIDSFSKRKIYKEEILYRLVYFIYKAKAKVFLYLRIDKNTSEIMKVVKYKISRGISIHIILLELNEDNHEEHLKNIDNSLYKSNFEDLELEIRSFMRKNNICFKLLEIVKDKNRERPDILMIDDRTVFMPVKDAFLVKESWCIYIQSKKLVEKMYKDIYN